ncbi:MAG: DUF1810 domain-containing protein [Pedobacter sp.]|nr:MAG: DUF1810 domain-containing protein [Pedobacter sp.]
MPGLERFINAQKATYNTALAEVKNGNKTTHWMWYVFPQLQGLGSSDKAQFYGIEDLDEAKAYLANPVLGKRLIAICEALIELGENDALKIFGTPDHMKLKSSMTLFAQVPLANHIFKAVLQQYFGGQMDERTLALL